MSAEVDDEGRWIFQQAAVWPYIARSIGGEDQMRFNHATWHYVNLPVFLGSERTLTVNRSMGYPTQLPADQWNVAQALKYSLSVLASDALPSDRALAYCWVLHLTGDLHQPLHRAALFCERFPEGDRGGSRIPLVPGDNLHALWDGLLGRRTAE